jgi:hypothetical protein
MIWQIRAFCLAAMSFYTFRSFVLGYNLMTGHHSLAAEHLLDTMEYFASPLLTDFFDDYGKYKILCTTDNHRIKWGSYLIRCRDLKQWSERCAKDVQIYMLSHEQVQHRRDKKTEEAERKLGLKVFDATVSIKQPLAPDQRFGRMFLDVVDNYEITTANVSAGVEVIVQNDYHAHDKFADRKYYVVEHWYNSFPLDMLSDSDVPAFDLPAIEHVTTLKMATVWTNKLQPCPTLSPEPSDVTYYCIDEVYTIETWYQNYFFDYRFGGDGTDSVEMERLEKLLADPDQGPGRLYYELFWKYDVLVIPVKTATMPKLRYGNVQRAVSQMRSGVPVLLEIYGEVLEDFMDTYNYTCAYIMNNTTLVSSTKRQYWTFEEATEAMKSAELRRKCQEEGLRIVRDYSPSAIAKKQLRALGYEGEFNCSNT